MFDVTFVGSLWFVAYILVMCAVVVVVVVVVTFLLLCCSYIFTRPFFTLNWRRCFLWCNPILRFVDMCVNLVRQQRTLKPHEKRLLRKIFRP